MTRQSPSFLAHLKSILILPFMAIVIIPTLIHFGFEEKIFDFFSQPARKLISFLSAFFFMVGLLLMIRTINLFDKKGKGTLAPWNPPKKMVVAGPYRYVRNPMLVGVNFVLIGIACLLRNENILIWMIFFVFLNTLYFVKKEEPDLEKRFGKEYAEYKKNVSRWIPRLTPWESG